MYHYTPSPNFTGQDAVQITFESNSDMDDFGQDMESDDDNNIPDDHKSNHGPDKGCDQHNNYTHEYNHHDCKHEN